MTDFLNSYRIFSDRSSQIFQSSLPVPGATQIGKNRGAYFMISILAPRAGRDSLLSFVLGSWRDFNPHSSSGE